MSVLPDEMWERIMEIGIESKTLDYKSLCCLSIASRRLRRLASEDSLWSPLLLSDFPSSSKTSSSDNNDRNNSIIDGSSSTSNGKVKSLYKIRYEKDRDKKRLAHRRAVLTIESEIAVRLRKIQEVERQSSEEKEKVNKAVSEVLNLRRIRQASVAVNVWQPEIIRGKQREMIQQNNVPVDFRINSLEMELKLCKQQISGFDKALRAEKRKLQAAKEELASLTYHPLQDSVSSRQLLNECRIRSKKLKHSSAVKM